MFLMDETFNNLKNDISIYFKLVKDKEHIESLTNGKLSYIPIY